MWIDTWVASERQRITEWNPPGSLNHLRGDFFPGFLWPIILICLVQSIFGISQDPPMYTHISFSFLTLSFLLCIGVQLINNVVVVSGKQWRDSAICIQVSILPQAPLPSRLPHNMEQSSMCCITDLCWLSILNIAVCPWPSQGQVHFLSLWCAHTS